MERYKCDEFLELMATSYDLQAMLKEQKRTQAQLLVMLRSKRARKQIKQLRRLGRIHGQLLVARYSPAAVNRLFALVQDHKQKPEVSLRASTALVQLMDLDFNSGKKSGIHVV